MKAWQWRRAGRLKIAGIAFVAIMVATSSDDGRVADAESPAPAESGAAPAPRLPRTADAPPRGKSVLKGTLHVELERLKRKQEVDASEGSKPATDAPIATPEVINAFAATSWYVPPPPPPPTPAQKPTAPPLPFTYLGRYEDAATATAVVMLAQGERLYTVSEGEVIGSTYRVGRITPGAVELIYLPLNMKQLLPTGDI